MPLSVLIMVLKIVVDCRWHLWVAGKGWENFIIKMFKIYKNLYYYLRTMDAKGAITLTPNEKQIFDMLKTYRDELQIKTVLRVAGGWVRDKVLDR